MVSETVALVLTFLLMSTCNAQLPPVNGFTLGSATFVNGFVRFVKDLEWTLMVVGQPIESLRLAGRDEGSVYLCGTARSFSLQIDYENGWILEDNVQKYQITFASPSLINGYNIGTVHYPGGNLEHIEPRYWEATNPRQSGSPIRFEELYRDEWSVYLESLDQEMFMQLDYHRHWLRVRPVNGIYHDVFRITQAEYKTKYLPIQDQNIQC